MFSSFNLFKKAGKISIPFLLLLLATFQSMAQGPKPPASINNPFVTIMLVIIFLLALIIFMMGHLVMGAAGLYVEKQKNEADAKKNNNLPIAAGCIALLLVSVTSFAQDANAAKDVATTAAGTYNGISATAYYLLSSVAVLELLIIVVLLAMLRTFTGIKKAPKVLVAAEGAVAPVQEDAVAAWWEKFNRFKPIHEEVDIDLGHNYDGIRELDNNLPPWWLYGFYLTILFAGFYIYTHVVSHSEPNPAEEYQASVEKAEIEKAAYLEKAANNVDENTVKLLTADADLAAGKKVFEATCLACHGKLGEGGVGPNLTDDFWLHGGAIKDVFKTIKYGWQEKGMKSWKDDFSPIQIAQIASYVKSLHGTNPPNGKAPQGTLFTESASKDAPAKDSTTTKKAS